MKYDRDLLIARRVFIVLNFVNFGTALLNGWSGNWRVSIASLVWAFGCLAMVAYTGSQQATRDQVRAIGEAIKWRDESWK